MMLFDTHAHLDMKSMAPSDAEEILARAAAAGVAHIVAVAGSDTPGDFSKTFAIAARHPEIRVAVGVHPHAASEFNPATLDKIRFALDKPNAVALGEIGLDYHYNFSEPKAQRSAFVKQLRIARIAGTRVVIHTREADEDTLSILKDEGAADMGGVIHCFSSGSFLAEGALSLGFYLSFSGIVTFPKADEIREVALSMPIEKMLTETDSPYLAPVPHRGRPNEPAFVRHIAAKLAEVRNIPFDNAAEVLYRNASQCFGMSTTP